ncbi:hypothetical protein R1flu_007284 [Riccia fluitans]|uniref:Uncharacterized protein n=1 Tax=Riccia fluitans TaxID=41844 RepID=A0ABD1YYN7_9MARC
MRLRPHDVAGSLRPGPVMPGPGRMRRPGRPAPRPHDMAGLLRLRPHDAAGSLWSHNVAGSLWLHPHDAAGSLRPWPGLGPVMRPGLQRLRPHYAA